jgi:hypothetical protein
MSDKKLGSGPTVATISEHGYSLILEEQDGLRIGLSIHPHETDGVYLEADERHESAHLHLSDAQMLQLAEYLLSVHNSKPSA